MSGSLGPVPEGGARTPRWGLARVVNDSMLPTLEPGDRLLVSYRRVPRPSDLVVARLPGGILAVKRVVERRATDLGAPGWWLLSDNAAKGTDSRHYGVVPDGDIVAVVLRRIWPVPRRRAVPDSNGA